MGFFKAYDMRGTFGIDFDLDVVYRVGLSLPQVVGGGRWLVGRDVRTTGEKVGRALIAGLREAGAVVTDIGPCTTPMVYYFTAADGYNGSVMVTASHNPPADNGLKVSKLGALPVGYADGLNEVERMVRSMSAKCPAATDPVVSSVDAAALERYLGFVGSICAPLARKLKVGVDCSNGMASLFARRMFPEAEIINDVLDGNFPAHSPNPLKSEAREQLAALVREKRLDCGIVFDGDADRAMFVDERGNFVQPDYLIPAVASACGGRAADRRVVLHDVRTSRGAIETLSERGFEPVMVPVGHAFAKPAMRKRNALCGGELAGHYYFGDFFGCDSGLIAALRVLCEFSRQDRPFSEWMSPVVSRYANSGELNFRVEDKEAAIERVLEAGRAFGKELSRSEMDGIRVELADGWFNIRKSNTEPYLRLIVEARTQAMLEDWVSKLSAAI